MLLKSKNQLTRYKSYIWGMEGITQCECVCMCLSYVIKLLRNVVKKFKYPLTKDILACTLVLTRH